MKKLPIWLMLDLLCIILAGCSDMVLRNTLADIVAQAKNAQTAPAAPSGLTATATSASDIHLTWTDNSSNEDGFKIDRSADGSTGWTQVQQTVANAASCDDTGLSAGTSYYYRVCAYNAGGTSAYSNIANATTNQTPPAAPSGLSALALSVSSIGLSWTDNSSNEAGFKIERSPDGSTGWTQMQMTAANSTTWDDTGLTAGTPYYYRVRATNTAGDSQYSSTANTSTFFTIMVAISAASDSFTMGDGSYGPNISESISYNYYMSKCEITNAEFTQFIADAGYSTQSFWTTNGWTQKTSEGWTEPGYWTDGNFNGANQPVVEVSWYEAVAFCNWRSAKEGLTLAYNSSGQATLSANGYRLPTEVEWEYAAAKGASGQAERIYAWGSTWDSSKAVCSVPPASASYPADVGSRSTGNPATTGDTPQGLCDMSGNVWEWCSDNYQAVGSITTTTDRYYYVNDTADQYFMPRGGSWSYNNTDESIFRCAFRFSDYGYYSYPNSRSDAGFRVVRR